MFIIFLRAIILYIALLIVMRLMGKRQIGEMQPFEFIITLLIAELACIPMTDVSIPLSYGLISVLAVFILHQIMSLLERTGQKMKFVISGKPSIVINPNGIDLNELKRNNMGVEDLIEAMRSLGYFNFDDLKYAIFESNGKLSALENEQQSEKKDLPYLLINDGKINKDNFLKFELTVDELNEKIVKATNAKQSIKSLKEIEVLTMTNFGRIYLQKKNEKYQIIEVEIK